MDSTTPTPTPTPTPEPEAAPVRTRMRWWKKALIGAGVAVVVIALAGALLYFVGGMSGSVYDPDIERAYQQMVVGGQVKPVEKRFVIGIPGCQCHSTDPYLTQQHRSRRMSQCMGCHGGAGSR